MRSGHSGMMHDDHHFRHLHTAPLIFIRKISNYGMHSVEFAVDILLYHASSQQTLKNKSNNTY